MSFFIPVPELFDSRNIPKCTFLVFGFGLEHPVFVSLSGNFIYWHLKQQLTLMDAPKKGTLPKSFTNCDLHSINRAWINPTNAAFWLQLHWTSSLINLTIRVPHLDFNVCFGVAGWPWYQIHYFFSASVPSNSPSAWYITTDRCDLGSNAVLRFHTLRIHLLLELAPGTRDKKSWLEPVKITASLTMGKIIGNDSGINSEVDPERLLLNNQKTKQQEQW